MARADVPPKLKESLALLGEAITREDKSYIQSSNTPTSHNACGETAEVESLVHNLLASLYNLVDPKDPIYQPGGALWYQPVFFNVGRYINLSREPLEILTRIYITPQDRAISDLYSAINQYWLSYGELKLWGYIFLAINQILETFSMMYYAGEVTAFRLDPQYCMLSMLEQPLSFITLQGYVMTLQTRVLESRDRIVDIVKRIEWSLQPVEAPWTIPDRQVELSSVESVHEEFGTRTRN
ncbi:hypothetical protein C8J56DRAFT_879826 [Mycena floridula]|nr:hypothetical protein C8J56DRAFT_879826 [Mycena floridula]